MSYGQETNIGMAEMSDSQTYGNVVNYLGITGGLGPAQGLPYDKRHTLVLEKDDENWPGPGPGHAAPLPLCLALLVGSLTLIRMNQDLSKILAWLVSLPGMTGPSDYRRLLPAASCVLSCIDVERWKTFIKDCVQSMATRR
nr:hypothetical protein CFP56_24533 [Quercus suber]